MFKAVGQVTTASKMSQMIWMMTREHYMSLEVAFEFKGICFEGYTHQEKIIKSGFDCVPTLQTSGDLDPEWGESMERGQLVYTFTYKWCVCVC